MKWCFADIFEVIAGLAPASPALISGGTRRTWLEYEDRAARLGAVLAGAGIGPGSKVALYGYNSSEYLEAQFGIFKARAVPVNVNYRYVEHELLYLLDNSDAQAVFFDAQFAPRLAAVRDRLPQLKLFVCIDDGTGRALPGALDFEAVIDAHERLPRMEASEDDIYMLYTGGTTGMPKGVMYRQGDFTRSLANAAFGPDAPQTGEAFAVAVEARRQQVGSPVSLAACPLMHGTGLWLGVFIAHFVGGAAVTFRNDHFDPHAVWRLIERERVTNLTIVGDAFGRPMLAALNEARDAGRSYDISSLKQIMSSGVMLSIEVKRGLLDFADLTIVDAMGSTEGGMGSSVVSRALPPSETARFDRNPTTKVFNEWDEEVQPGSDEIGMIANGGFAPIGYYKDPEKSARTFRTIAGQRYSFPGDLARVAADGSLILLGRGSACINTGGEKVFPEEVEEVLKTHGSVWDALVVGVPDERFGERVTAVLSPRPGQQIDEDELLEFVRERIAGYKAPRRLVIVDTVRRAPNGKADYKWAKEVVLKEAS